IEQALAQLREEEREELLAALEGRFREILERHKPITASTIALDKTRAERPWTRTEQLELAEIAQEEKTLAAMVHVAYEILVEDGTTVVFPRVVAQLEQDMLNVHGLLDGERTGSFTQDVEREIEQTLEELIAALERAQEQQQQQGRGQGQGQSQQQLQPLVPDSAELKLLKSAQLRVNKRTKSFDKARPQDNLDPEMKRQIHKIADRQEDVSRMAEDMLERP
ncbi:MAG: hypothetical protein ACODAJ_12455, partial [Planctomycetota bacterium]